MNKHKKLGGWIYQNSLPLCLISPSAVIIHKDVFSDIGLFDENYPYAEDYDLWLRVTPYYEIGFIETPLIKKYGGDDDQLSRNWGLDLYRVKSLEKMMNNDDLKIGDKEKTLKLLIKKLKILEKGYRKHGRLELADTFKERLNHYSNLIFVT
jgi:GT2 family glycosyltransferase